MSVAISLHGKTALVTGGSSGLGPHIAKKLDEAGASVAIAYHRNQAGAQQLVKQLTQSGCLVQVEMTDPASVQSLFETAVSNLGSIDILVNCAAAESQDVADMADLSIDRWRRTQQANVDAPFLLMQLLASQHRPASAINISSIEASRPASGHSHYSTSKAALEMLTKAAALEFGPIGLRVNAIAPGLIWREGIDEGWPEGVTAWQQAAPLGNQLQSPAKSLRWIAVFQLNLAGSDRELKVAESRCAGCRSHGHSHCQAHGGQRH
jgi:NAD(P)-dependent dehydrogenase (short-subunit alcohol dehydrogenase family)